MKIDRIFIDMDGVLANFVQGACKEHGKQDPYLDPDSYGIFEMEKLWGITPTEFWKPLSEPGFWLGLEKMPEADDLVSMVCRMAGPSNVAILSSPSDSLYCIPEKKEWIRKHYPELANNLIFTSSKRFLASPTSVLIDDYDRNIDSFMVAGGLGILYPQKWNRLHWETRTPSNVKVHEELLDYARQAESL